MVSGSVIGIVLLENSLCLEPASAAGKRADYLDIVAGSERFGRPLGTADYGAVDSNGDKPGDGIDAAVCQQLTHSRHRELLLHSIDLEPHYRTSAAMPYPIVVPKRRPLSLNRSGVNGRTASGKWPVNTKALIASAVSGVSRIPLR